MKKLTTIIAAALVSLALAAQSFDEEYKRTEFVTTLGEHIYNGPVMPVWTGEDNFVFQTNEPGGKAWYRVQGAVKTPVLQSVYDEARASLRDTYYDPSDESMFSLGPRAKAYSPDSTLVAFIRDNNVWISAPDGSGAMQLSFDGTDAETYVQMLWSPDGSKIAALRKEVMKERQIVLRESRPADQVQPHYKYLDYAKPGDRLPQCTPALLDVKAGGPVALDRSIPRDQYFLELGEWAQDGSFFTFEYNRRGHQLYELCAVDAASGAVRTLAKEESDTFIYYYDLWRHLYPDGKHVLWISERDDWRHLYCIDTRTLKMRQLTRGEWNVREIHYVAPDGSYILANANGLHAAKGEDPYNKHVIRIDAASGTVTDLTPENANHEVFMSPDFKTFVDNYSRPDLPSTSVLRSSEDGKVLMVIQKADVSRLLGEDGFTMPEVFKAKGRDGVTDIWGTIWRPAKFNPKKKYPVIEYIYAGPHDSHVEKDFMPYIPRFMRLADLGFIVVTIDGMGTDNRSKSFQDVAWRNLKDAGFPDRILWMKAAAAKYKYMDISNVGIFGYSAGGQNTLAALLFHPEFYKVGVALCGCHDNRMDKIWWNEQWMGYPVGPWYSENSNVDNAWRLEGKLFIINGEMDDNVDPASSLQVVSELVKNDKDFEQLYLPGFTHNLSAPWVTRRVFEFFWRNCK